MQLQTKLQTDAFAKKKRLKFADQCFSQKICDKNGAYLYFLEKIVSIYGGWTGQKNVCKTAERTPKKNCKQQVCLVYTLHV